ncbi:MAG: bifunctional phosphopantothenoylcysteine decarboxylase/phosphopantothenate--cysteine ligase CoaBC [Alphaproteobacteria bacterium]|nr:bifunctional phosphopantothenoylcysteine decarboxylase/phosphopantothenate--cysteine ligase CoaBC [Alphaproteobacteria bacterium]
MLSDRRILLIIGGGIAAYKSLELIRRLRERGAAVRCVLTAGATQFITPLSVAALSEDKAYTELFSLTDESEMGHIRLSREADLLVVAPATADLIARMAAGLADDLAATVLLATDKPVLIAPSMNVMMWQHAATQSNVELLRRRGVATVGPAAGDLACGEVGSGRLAEVPEIVAAIEAQLSAATGLRALPGPLEGRRALVTSGPTYEAIDPVRFIGNRSSGKQGHAIAGALAAAGAHTVLVAGPTAEPTPPGVELVRIESAREMLAACERALPVDVAVCAAAVADWRVEMAGAKLKKHGNAPPALQLIENPDILASLAAATARPRLVVGFAAETERVVEQARAKRLRKRCDWIVANDVSIGTTAFGGERNRVHLITEDSTEDWPEMTKLEIAQRLVGRIAQTLGHPRGAA